VTWQPKPPPATELTRAQYDGYACCWCGTSLWQGAISVGRARGSIGAHVLDVEVYACSKRCPKRPRRPHPRTAKE
jgi:hypothetical protein